MERAVWLCACVLALSLALGISSYSASAAQQPHNLEISPCKIDNANANMCKALSEKFLRKITRKTRKAYA